MKTGLIVSLVAHVVVGAISIAGIPALKRDVRLPPQPVPVEFIAIDDVTRTVEEPQAPAPVQESPPQVTASVDRVERTQPAARNDAVPTPDAAPAREVETEAPRQAFTRAAPRSKPRAPSALDTDRLAALIDRSITETAQQRTPPEDTDKQLEAAVERARANQLQSRIATATLVDAIRQKVEGCWALPAGAKDAENLIIRIRIFLRPDGQLARAPEYLDRGRMSDSFYRAAAESAARAVRQCAPYDLPPELYQQWAVLDFNFDPRHVLGG